MGKQSNIGGVLTPVAPLGRPKWSRSFDGPRLSSDRRCIGKVMIVQFGEGNVEGFNEGMCKLTAGVFATSCYDPKSEICVPGALATHC